MSSIKLAVPQSTSADVPTVTGPRHAQPICSVQLQTYKQHFVFDTRVTPGPDNCTCLPVNDLDLYVQSLKPVRDVALGSQDCSKRQLETVPSISCIDNN